MAHEIDIVNGKALMAWHEGRGIPWHGLGTMIPEGQATSENVIKLAGLDWKVGLRPLYYSLDDDSAIEHEAPDRFAVVRDLDGTALGTVGKRYTPIQNHEAFESMDAFSMDGRMEYECAGALKGGKVVFILARLGEDHLVGGVDPVKPYVLLYTSHDGSSGLTVQLATTRVVCANTLAVAQNEKDRISYQIRHTASAPERMAKASEALQVTSKKQKLMLEAFERMAQTKADEELLDSVVEILAPTPREGSSDLVVDRHKRQRLQLWKELESPSVAFAGGKDTRWGLFNLATQHLDWTEQRKGMNGKDSVERRTIYSMGLGAADLGPARRQQVFDLLKV